MGTLIAIVHLRLYFDMITSDSGGIEKKAMPAELIERNVGYSDGVRRTEANRLAVELGPWARDIGREGGAEALGKHSIGPELQVHPRMPRAALVMSVTICGPC